MGADIGEGGAVNIWPGLLSLDLAAKYCSMKPVEFLKAVAAGDLPQPVLIDGKERWRLADIDGMFTERKAEKPWLKTA